MAKCNHIDPATFVQRDGKAYCAGCGKFIGYVGVGRIRSRGPRELIDEDREPEDDEP